MSVEIAVVRDIKSLETEWLAFQGEAFGTFYQTYEWCSAWQECVGGQRGSEPHIVTGRSPSGALLFLLPLAIHRRAGLRVLQSLAMAQSSYCYGLFERDFLTGAESFFGAEGWGQIAEACRADAVLLRDLPAILYGYRNPLTPWFTMLSRNSSYAMTLAGGYEALYAAKRSAETRRGARKRDAKLEAAGKVEFGLPRDLDSTHMLLEQMFAQQRDRLAESGIHGVFGRLEREFIHRLADARAGGRTVLLPYHLSVNGKMEAMMLGGSYANRYWALISSLGGEAFRKYSPGDSALRRTIEACCASGMEVFDFSSGDTSYKLQWADETIPLYDVVRGVTPRGYAWAVATGAGLLAKRAIKRTPLLWALATALRKVRART